MRDCTIVGLGLALLLTISTTLPLKKKDHHMEDFRNKKWDISFAVRKVENDDKKIPELWERDVVSLKDPTGKSPKLMQTVFGTNQAVKESATPSPAISSSPCVPFYNGTVYACASKSVSPTPCVPSWNGTYYGCHSVKPVPPSMMPCTKVYNGTDWNCVKKTVHPSPSSKPCVKFYNGTDWLCRSDAPCHYSLNGTGWGCESPTPSSTPCGYSFNGTTWGCHKTKPDMKYSPSTAPCHYSRNGTVYGCRTSTPVIRPSTSPCLLSYNGTHWLCPQKSPSPIPCVRTYNGTHWGCQKPHPMPTNNSTHISSHICSTPLYNASGWHCPPLYTSAPRCVAFFKDTRWECHPDHNVPSNMPMGTYNYSPSNSPKMNPCLPPTYNSTGWHCPRRHSKAPHCVPVFTNSEWQCRPPQKKPTPMVYPQPSMSAIPTFVPPTISTGWPITPPMINPSHSKSSEELINDLIKQYACFPGRAIVQMESGERKLMSQLHVGDRVLTSHGMYSTVFAFTHRDSSIVSRFVRIVTASGDTLQLSAGHYISVNGVLSAAGYIRTGDTLMRENGETTTVAQLSIGEDRGLYNPQTLDGYIVVDDIVATTFTVAVQPAAARAILAPLATIFRLFGMDLIGDTMAIARHRIMTLASQMIMQ